MIWSTANSTDLPQNELWVTDNKAARRQFDRGGEGPLLFSLGRSSGLKLREA